MNLNLMNLKYFKTVADCGSVSKAAKQLFVAQPSLSQTIKRIEDEVGIPLFRRTPSGTILTFAGERYYLMASQMLKLYEDFLSEVSDVNDLQSGTLSFGLTSPISRNLLPDILPKLKREYPDVTTNISIHNSYVLREMVLYGKLDFAIMHRWPTQDSTGLDFRPAMQTPFLIFVPADDPVCSEAEPYENQGFPVLDPAKLKQHMFLAVEEGQHSTVITKNVLQKAGIEEPNIVMTLRDPYLVYRMVAEGFGAAILPYEIIAHHNPSFPSVKIFSIPESYNATWETCIVTAKNMPLGKFYSFFIDMIVDIIKEKAGPG